MKAYAVAFYRAALIDCFQEFILDIHDVGAYSDENLYKNFLLAG